MNQQVIEKYNLKETRQNLGTSFIHAVKIYQFTDSSYIGECNHDGEPTPGKCIILYTGEKKGWRIVSTEFLLSIDRDIALKALDLK